jgi:hypothetical protein
VVVDRPYGTVGLGQVRDLDGGDVVARAPWRAGGPGQLGGVHVGACHQSRVGRVVRPRPRVTT